jgi:hypothetical protein
VDLLSGNLHLAHGVLTDSNNPVPSATKVRLTWNNSSPQSGVRIQPTGNNQAGDRYFIPVPVASAVTSTRVGRDHALAFRGEGYAADAAQVP